MQDIKIYTINKLDFGVNYRHPLFAKITKQRTNPDITALY